MCLRRGIRTRDLGGSAGTREFGEAVIRELARERLSMPGPVPVEREIAVTEKVPHGPGPGRKHT